MLLLNSWRRTRAFALLCALVGVLAPGHASAIVVRFSTTVGDIDVRLFDGATPLSVANFLAYVTDGDYDGSFFHRAPKQYRRDAFGVPVKDAQGNYIVDTFVVQGGGFKYSDQAGLSAVPTDPPVLNEPGISNLPGTLAYAKQGGSVNSATSGFFFNTVDNSGNLDNQNGGFTVFGRVVGGSESLDAVTQLDVFDLDPPDAPTAQNPNPVNPPTFDDVPLLDIPGSLGENLIYLQSVSVLDIPDGDYNFDGAVNAADYVVWRNALGSTTQVAADGNGNGVVDQADYTVWATHYGQSTALAESSPNPAPEPACVTLLLGAAALLVRLRVRA